MTRSELRSACDQVGGVYVLAAMLGKRPKYLYRRLNGETEITTLDALAVQKVLELAATKEENGP